MEDKQTVNVKQTKIGYTLSVYNHEQHRK